MKVLTLVLGKFFLVLLLHPSCCSGSLFYPSGLRRVGEPFLEVTSRSLCGSRSVQAKKLLEFMPWQILFSHMKVWESSGFSEVPLDLHPGPTGPQLAPILCCPPPCPHVCPEPTVIPPGTCPERRSGPCLGPSLEPSLTRGPPIPHRGWSPRGQVLWG